MQKRCSRCGGEMGIMLRNVVYRNRVKIRNVPVHVCLDENCAHSQVVEFVKDDLKALMNDLGQEPQRQEIQFGEISEFSNLLVIVADQKDDFAAKSMIEERINQLLDLLLLAKSLGDQRWIMEVHNRLIQVLPISH